jgi:hypothetical protein
MFKKKLGVFKLLYVIGDILLLTFRSLVIDVYTPYLIDDNCIKSMFMNNCRMFLLEIWCVKIFICYTRSRR